MRAAQPRPADPMLLAALTDAWMPAAFMHMEQPTFVPTIDLTIHWRAAPGVPAGEHPWVLGLFTTRLGGGRHVGGGRRAVERGRRPARPVAPARDRPRARDDAIGHLGLGSNVGDRRANLQAAVDALPAHGVSVLASSSVYDTEPVGEVLDQPEFLNAVIRVETALGPEELLDACKAVERSLGREAGGVRHGPRPIDVDVLLLGDVAWRRSGSTLPHAQVTSRRFVLVPLLEVDPDVRLPDGSSAARRWPRSADRPRCAARARRCRSGRARIEGTLASLPRRRPPAEPLRRKRARRHVPGIPGNQRSAGSHARRPPNARSTSSIVQQQRQPGADLQIRGVGLLAPDARRGRSSARCARGGGRARRRSARTFELAGGVDALLGAIATSGAVSRETASGIGSREPAP